MIEYKTGDLLTEDVEALVNTVNCVGVMGRGIALQFKNAFPDNFKAYAAACKRGEISPGRMFVFETGLLTNPRLILNFPTKRHWRSKSRIEDIDSGLQALAYEICSRQIRSIAIPPLGSGLGGLEWPVVRTRIEAALQDLNDLQILVFEPAAPTQADEMTHNLDVPQMTPGRAALVCLIHRYLYGLLDPFVTSLEIHKLMYFMQASGQPLQLKYVKSPHGPHAENLCNVLRSMEGNTISGYVDSGDVPDKPIQLVFGANEKAENVLRNHSETHACFQRVSDLIAGFESSFGLELLSTVHWIVCNESAVTVEDIVEKVYAWDDRKTQFSKRQIELAVRNLSNKNWINQVSVEVNIS